MKKTDYQPPESLVIRFMREKRKLTLLFVGKKTGLKPKTIDHMESGRRIMTKEEIDVFLNCYEFSSEVFNQMLELRPLSKKMANNYFLQNL